jgi:hypothetical protein
VVYPAEVLETCSVSLEGYQGILFSLFPKRSDRETDPDEAKPLAKKVRIGTLCTLRTFAEEDWGSPKGNRVRKQFGTIPNTSQ